MKRIKKGQYSNKNKKQKISNNKSILSLSGRLDLRLFGWDPIKILFFNDDRTKIFINIINKNTNETFKVGEINLIDISKSFIFICFEELCEPSELSNCGPFYFSNFLAKYKDLLVSYQGALKQNTPRLNKNYKYCEVAYQIDKRTKNFYDIKFSCNVHHSSHLTVTILDVDRCLEQTKFVNVSALEYYNIRHFASLSLRNELEEINYKYKHQNILDYHGKVKKIISSHPQDYPENDLLRKFPEIIAFFCCLKRITKNYIPLICIDTICKYCLE